MAQEQTKDPAQTIVCSRVDRSQRAVSGACSFLLLDVVPSDVSLQQNSSLSYICTRRFGRVGGDFVGEDRCSAGSSLRSIRSSAGPMLARQSYFGPSIGTSCIRFGRCSRLSWFSICSLL